MSTNLQKFKRETKQIRISADLHKEVKLRSIECGMTISKFVDKIIKKYFKLNKN
ncbi:MAG: hypothetical protein UR22_C0001G0066 [Parcubacteria group bacterium GW2011_GWC2_32_10]|nr:MAG: hypothetical protein UR22_C0001G0066 [Parcubacteria group bacterium GW2011_GWC2_32_10]